MPYQPTFMPGEYHKPSRHYVINVGEKRIVYAYIRKNACSAFKRLIQSNMTFQEIRRYPLKCITHARYLARRKIKFLSFRVSTFSRPGFADEIMFVYRDPIERFIAVFINKFVHNANGGDIHNSFERVTGISVEQAAFADFLNYAKNDFSIIDCHLLPQESHLYKTRYSRVIDCNHLHREMSGIIGTEHADRWFKKKVNSSAAEGRQIDDLLINESVGSLRKMTERGVALEKHNFLNDDVADFLRQKYSCDYEMISAIKRDAA